MRSAFSVVPAKVLTFKFCLSALKKKFDLPSVLVNCRDSRRAEVEVVGEQIYVPVVILVPHGEQRESVGVSTRVKLRKVALRKA